MQSSFTVAVIKHYL